MCVRMRRCFVGLMRRVIAVNMKMGVAAVAVPVRMRMNAVRKRMAKTPDADRDQHDSHEPLRNRRNRIDRKAVAKRRRKQADQQHAAGMSQAPANTCGPAALRPAYRKRRYRREMIRPGPHVQEPGKQSRHQSKQNLHAGTVNRAIEPVELFMIYD